MESKEPDYILPEKEIEYFWATKFWDYPRAGLCKIDGHICYFLERLTHNDDTAYVIGIDRYQSNGVWFEDEERNYQEVINYWCWKLPFWLRIRFLLEKKILEILVSKYRSYPERYQMQKDVYVFNRRKPNKFRDWLCKLYYQKSNISESFHKKIDSIYYIREDSNGNPI